ncbi:hypothetical protein [Pseudonocardia sp.]|uniref:hypothetical protein n=1 Tax=Pseudonocardia sp. TaxID=60912 RepID=UPI003D14BC00
MNNDALVAALGMDAVAAVHGYRLSVLDEARRRGHRVVSQALSDVVPISSGVCVVVDPIDIRLTVTGPAGGVLTGSTLVWNPAEGWSLARPDARPTFFAGPGAESLDLVPTAPEVLAWATDGAVGPTGPPLHVDLDEDTTTIGRLLAFIDPGRLRPMFDAFAPGSRPGPLAEPAEPAEPHAAQAEP